MMRPTNPSLVREIIGTFKERIARARSTLGKEKADAVIADLQKELRYEPTLKKQVDALEKAVENPAQHLHLKASLPSPQAAAPKPETGMGAFHLCAQYDALTSDDQRRAFWNRHEKTLSDPKGKIPGLVQICMSAAKPLSIRARFQLPATARAGELVMSKKDWLALEPFEQGQWQALGGKVVPETIKRSLFQQLAPRDQTEFCLNGGRVID